MQASKDKAKVNYCQTNYNSGKYNRNGLALLRVLWINGMCFRFPWYVVAW